MHVLKLMLSCVFENYAEQDAELDVMFVLFL